MKKTIKILFSLLITFLIVGCVRAQIDMEITKDGDVTLVIISAMQMTEDMEDLTEEDSNSIVDDEGLKNNGFTITEYNEKDYKGVKASKSYKLSEVSGVNPIIIDLNKIGEDDWNDKQLFQDIGEGRYKGSFVFDTSEDYDPEMESFASNFDISYSVTLPTKAISHNADSVDGNSNTLTWKVKYGEKKIIEYEFKLADNTNVSSNSDNQSTCKGISCILNNSNMTLYYIIGGMIGVVVILAIAITIQKNKRKY